MSELQVEIISESLRELQQGECPSMSVLELVVMVVLGRPAHEQPYHPFQISWLATNKEF